MRAKRSTSSLHRQVACTGKKITSYVGSARSARRFCPVGPSEHWGCEVRSSGGAQRAAAATASSALAWWGWYDQIALWGRVRRACGELAVGAGDRIMQGTCPDARPWMKSCSGASLRIDACSGSMRRCHWQDLSGIRSHGRRLSADCVCAGGRYSTESVAMPANERARPRACVH
jgi:hypothetical protein